MKRKIPKKNYIYYIFMIIITVIITLSFFTLNNIIKNKKLENSYLNGYVNEVKINEITNIISEPSTDLFILLTKTNNNDIYNDEIKIKQVLVKNDLRDSFVYIILKDTNELNKLLNTDINNIPSIIYLKNGKVVKYIEKTNEIDLSSEFEKLIEEYEVNK